MPLYDESAKVLVPDENSILFNSINLFNEFQRWPAVIAIFDIDHVKKILKDNGFIPTTHTNSLFHTIGVFFIAAVFSVLRQKSSITQLHADYCVICTLCGVKACSHKTIERAMKQKDAITNTMNQLAQEVCDEFQKEFYGRDLQTIGVKLAQCINKIEPKIKRIVVGDGSECRLARELNIGETKGKTVAGRKGLFFLDASSNAIIDVKYGSAVCNEKEAAKLMIEQDTAAEGTLYMFDAGFNDKSLMQVISDKQAFYLIKARHSINPEIVKVTEYNGTWNQEGRYIIDNEGKDLSISTPMKLSELFDRELISPPLTGCNGKLEGKSYKLTRKDGTSVLMIFNPTNKSFDETKKKSAWVYFDTNIPDSIFIELVSVLYRVRWQIEIKFKCIKSHGGMDKGPDLNRYTSDFFVSASIIADTIKLFLALTSLQPLVGCTKINECSTIKEKNDELVNVSMEKAAAHLANLAMLFLLISIPTNLLTSKQAIKCFDSNSKNIANVVKASRPSKRTLEAGKALKETLRVAQEFADQNDAEKTLVA